MGPQKTSRSAFGLCVLGCFILIAGRATAEESPWYLEATVGRADAQAVFGSRHLKWIDDESEAGAIAVGYTLGRHLAIQAGYHDMGSHRGIGSPCRESEGTCIEHLASLDLCVEGTDCSLVQVDLDADLSGFSLALVPRWPVSERLSLHGKVGVMAWDGAISGPSRVGRVETFSGEDLLLGLGLRFEFANGLGVLLEREELDLDVSSTLLGVSWQF